MHALKKLQNDFQAYLISNNKEIALTHIAPATPFNASQRLQVYHYAYGARLKDVLADDFSKCFILLGEEAFEKAALQYLALYPSHHFSVRYFGLHFSDFLKNTKPYSDFPILSEMARFEWVAQSTLDAKDAPLLTTDHLSLISTEAWPDWIFKFHPSVKLEIFEWDTVSIWRAIDQEQPERQANKLKTSLAWLLWRYDLRCFFNSLTDAQLIMVQGIQRNLAFGEICENLCAVLPEEEIPTIAMETLLSWINHGVMHR